jgi:hypothetical protein
MVLRLPSTDFNFTIFTENTYMSTKTTRPQGWPLCEALPQVLRLPRLLSYCRKGCKDEPPEQLWRQAILPANATIGQVSP